MKHLTKIAPPFTPDFFGEIGLNLGLGLITSCSRKTACWDLNTVVTKVKLVRGRWWFKKLLIFRYFAVISTRLYLGGVPESVYKRPYKFALVNLPSEGILYLKAWNNATDFFKTLRQKRFLVLIDLMMNGW